MEWFIKTSKYNWEGEGLILAEESEFTQPEIVT